MIIAIDFDGTCVTHEFPNVGKDIGAIPVLKKLVEAGHQLILWTVRSDCEDNSGFSDEVREVHNGKFLQAAVDWFKENDIPLHSIQCNPQQKEFSSSPKCYAQLYIDDAALGCPLIFPGDSEGVRDGRTYVKSDRAYVDWYTVHAMLIEKGIL